MVSSLFRIILRVSLRMTPPLLLVLLFSFLFRNKIQATTFLVIKKLMLIGALVIIIPTYMGSFIRIQDLANNIPLPDLHIDLPKAIFERQIILSGNDVVNPVIPNRNTILMMFEGIWFCGMILYAHQMVQKNIQLINSVRNIPKCDFPAICDFSNKLCREIGIKDPPALILSFESVSPQTVGWLRPVIILPDQNLLLSDENTRMLLLHELYHIKNKDNGWKLLASVVFTIYWFHPLVRWLVHSFSLECELACDEKVLKGASSLNRHEYAKMLLRFSSQDNSATHYSALQSGLKSDFIVVKQRIEQAFLSESKQSGYALLSVYILSTLLFFNIVGFQRAPVLLSQTKPILINSQQVSEDYLLSENPKGYAISSDQYNTSPQQEFRLPIASCKLISQKNVDEVGTAYRGICYFITTGENKTVTSIYNGVVAATQLKDQSDLNEAELELGSLGKYVIVDCGNGLSIRYTFLDSILVQPGQAVSAGDILGIAGHTGVSYGDTDQCGIYILQDGVMVDPLPYFNIDIPIEEIP